MYTCQFLLVSTAIMACSQHTVCVFVCACMRVCVCVCAYNCMRVNDFVHLWIWWIKVACIFIHLHVQAANEHNIDLIVIII